MNNILVKNAWIVTMDSERRMMEKGAVAIEGKNIVAVDESKKVEKEFKADKVIDAGGKILMPGLICTHFHTHVPPLIGMPCEVPSADIYSILRDWCWPQLEDKLTKEDLYTLSRMTSIELIKNGTTCIGNVTEAPYVLPGALESVAKAIMEVNIRGVLSFEATERVSKKNAELGIQENLNFVKKWNNLPNSLVKGRFGLHTVYTCSPEMLQKVRELANRYGGGIHLHVEEGLYDVEYSEKTFKKLPIEHLRDIGFLSSDVLAAECVFITDTEIKILKEKDVKVAHSVLTNMEFCASVTPVPRMLNEGITVGLATDGFFYDMFEVMRTTFLVHKVHVGDPEVLPTEKVLEMGTIEGAKALGLEEEIGSIEVGKKADLILLDLRNPTPLLPKNICYQIVAIAHGSDVETAIIDGEIVMENRNVLKVSEEEAFREGFETATEIWRKNQYI